MRLSDTQQQAETVAKGALVLLLTWFAVKVALHVDDFFNKPRL